MMKFDDVFRAQLRELLIWRRDVRRFRTEALPPGTVERLIDMACLAPSVEPQSAVAICHCRRSRTPPRRA